MIMLRRVRFGLFLACLAVLAPPSWGQEVSLELKFKEGESRKAKVWNAIEVYSEGLPGGKYVQEETRILRRVTKKVHADGTADIVVSHVDYSRTVNGEAVSLDASDGLSMFGLPVEVPLLVTLSKRGNILDIKPTKELRPSQKEAVERILESTKQERMDLPAKPVEPGHEWEYQVALSVDPPGGMGTLDLVIDTKATFAAVETADGRRCARIETAGKGLGAFDEAAGTLEMTSGSSTLLDLERGLVVETTSEAEVLVVFSLPEGERTIRQVVKGSEKEIRAPGKPAKKAGKENGA